MRVERADKFDNNGRHDMSEEVISRNFIEQEIDKDLAEGVKKGGAAQ